eukprot:3564336-Rhodomonas_salina.1
MAEQRVPQRGPPPQRGTASCHTLCQYRTPRSTRARRPIGQLTWRGGRTGGRKEGGSEAVARKEGLSTTCTLGQYRTPQYHLSISYARS